jgi:predicted DNA-binding protein (MmcQ/YjbR family)
MQIITLYRLKQSDVKLTYKQFEYIYFMLMKQKDTKNYYTFREKFIHITYLEFQKYISLKSAPQIIQALKEKQEIKLRLFESNFIQSL